MSSRSTSRTFNGSINVVFINITSYNISQQQRPVPTPHHAVFSFLISALLNLLELKYQGNGITSPFQTDPKIMWVALVGLILYCFAYAVELESKFTQLGRAGMGLFGSILSVSLAYVLSRNSVSFVLCFLCALFSNRELLCFYIEVILRWIQQRTIADPLQDLPLVDRQWIVMHASVNRGGLLPV
ncbi:hypothetical protein Vadar_020991 [Vaccinium darrowii]|uniref:Uncharacterized protein n=1 Tax=Vaccinium darrowii TaxID=229202 RepID=A0ACB7ZCS3_9ERIC|nr:hypothetical protein Vadar_020991 [Vaccinium darrowii]